MNDKDLIDLFEKALNKAKTHGIEFISVSAPYDDCLMIEFLESSNGVLIAHTLEGRLSELEEWQKAELYINCMSWIEYKGK